MWKVHKISHKDIHKKFEHFGMMNDVVYEIFSMMEEPTKIKRI